jgi:hypothetical protein
MRWYDSSTNNLAYLPAAQNASHLTTVKFIGREEVKAFASRTEIQPDPSSSKASKMGRTRVKVI